MTDLAQTGAAAATAGPWDERLEQHRVELTAYCYRMLGSPFDAEDAVQETMVRAWRALDAFEGRASLRTWLFRIATNVCYDASKAAQRRARPVDLGPSSRADAELAPPTSEVAWLEPVPDGRVVADGDPAEVLLARESIRLAFVAALQHLPPRQRAVLILRDVLRWSAAEVAEQLGVSVASANSALQRARATLATRGVVETDVFQPLDDAQQHLLSRYVDAFERYDMDALTALLHEDATLSMPPYALWLQGPEEIRRWMLGQGIGCRGSRWLPTVANGSPAFAQYRPGPPGLPHQPWALQVLEVADGQVRAINAFLDTARLFPLFGLPPSL